MKANLCIVVSYKLIFTSYNIASLNKKDATLYLAAEQQQIYSDMEIVHVGLWINSDHLQNNWRVSGGGAS